MEGRREEGKVHIVVSYVYKILLLHSRREAINGFVPEIRGEYLHAESDCEG